MRILAGQLRGRELARPKFDSVRPMTQKEREALFNILGPVDGLTLLDAYAGSGAIGLEAISRGARLVTGIEADRAVCAVIRRNIADLGLGAQYRLAAQTVEAWLKAHNDADFDLIVAAPPFAALDAAVLGQLGRRLIETGIMVVSYSGRLETPALDRLELISDRHYGDGNLAFYRRP